MAADTVTKFCPHCKQIKARTDFHVTRSRPDGHTAHCKVCHYLRARKPTAKPRRAPDVIPPFPAHVDPYDFGHWLSGLVDGEGSFMLATKKYRLMTAPLPRANFDLGLRADDRAILCQVQSFWGCGRVTLQGRILPAGNPIFRYRVESWVDLALVVVPHFERYVLR